MSARNTSYQSHWFLIISGRRAWTHLSLQVRSDPDDTSLDGHHEGEADDSSDLQQSLLAQTPATLIRTTHLHQTHDDESSVMMSSIMMSSVMMSWLRTCSSPGRPARRCAGRQSWLSCCWSPGRTELYGGCWRPPRPAPTRRRRTPAGARRSPTPAAWSLRVWSVWTPEQHDMTFKQMNEWTQLTSEITELNRDEEDGFNFCSLLNIRHVWAAQLSLLLSFEPLKILCCLHC